MTAEAERLLKVLCSSTATTGESLSYFGVDMLALAVEKPSNNPTADELDAIEGTTGGTPA